MTSHILSLNQINEEKYKDFTINNSNYMIFISEINKKINIILADIRNCSGECIVNIMIIT
jgi:hypothetical protein